MRRPWLSASTTTRPRPGLSRASSFNMHLAWLYLLHAEFTRDGVDYRYWQPGTSRRLEKRDGEPKRWELARSVRQRWPLHQDAVRANLDFFIGLRNMIEHRFTRNQRSLSESVSGHAQALLLNYEEELTTQFGLTASLATRLRFPVFVGSFTTEGRRRSSRCGKHCRSPADLPCRIRREARPDGQWGLPLRTSASGLPRARAQRPDGSYC